MVRWEGQRLDSNGRAHAVKRARLSDPNHLSGVVGTRAMPGRMNCSRRWSGTSRNRCEVRGGEKCPRAWDEMGLPLIGVEVARTPGRQKLEAHPQAGPFGLSTRTLSRGLVSARDRSR